MDKIATNVNQKNKSRVLGTRRLHYVTTNELIYVDDMILVTRNKKEKKQRGDLHVSRTLKFHKH